MGIQGQFQCLLRLLESPPRPSLRQLATKNSQNFPPPNTQAIDYALDLSYSRSPSPTRRTIDRTKTVSLGFTYAESEFIEDFSEGYNEFAVQHGPSSRWNSVNSTQHTHQKTCSGMMGTSCRPNHQLLNTLIIQCCLNCQVSSLYLNHHHIYLRCLR